MGYLSERGKESNTVEQGQIEKDTERYRERGIDGRREEDIMERRRD